MNEIDDAVNLVMEGYKFELDKMGISYRVRCRVDELFLLPLMMDGSDEICDAFVSGFCAGLAVTGVISEPQAERLEKIILSARALIRIDL